MLPAGVLKIERISALRLVWALGHIWAQLRKQRPIAHYIHHYATS